MRLSVCVLVIAACGPGGGRGQVDAVPDSSELDASTVDAPAAAFGGVVALNTNLSSTDPFVQYRIEYPATYAIGARGVQTAADWRALEPSPTDNPCTPAYSLTMLTNPAFGLDVLTTDGFTDILLNVAIISMDRRTMPCDLVGLPFDHPSVKTRYRALLDQVIPHLGANVKYVSFGNEVDSYFKTHPGEWTAYKALIEEAKTHLKNQRPDIKVGVTTTFEGATSTFASQVASLNEHMDVIILTYYPLDFSTFRPRGPSTVAPDMAAAVALTGARQLVLQEWGYPSSGLLASDEQKQSDFIANTFAAWTSHGAAKIPFVSFFKRRDWTQAHCDAQCPATAPPQQCAAFAAYLCSLGLLRNDGSPKLAQQTLLDHMTALHIGS